MGKLLATLRDLVGAAPAARGLPEELRQLDDALEAEAAADRRARHRQLAAELAGLEEDQAGRAREHAARAAGARALAERAETEAHGHRQAEAAARAEARRDSLAFDQAHARLDAELRETADPRLAQLDGELDRLMDRLGAVPITSHERRAAPPFLVYGAGQAPRLDPAWHPGPTLLAELTAVRAVRPRVRDLQTVALDAAEVAERLGALLAGLCAVEDGERLRVEVRQIAARLGLDVRPAALAELA